MKHPHCTPSPSQPDICRTTSPRQSLWLGPLLALSASTNSYPDYQLSYPLLLAGAPVLDVCLWHIRTDSA